MAFLKDVGVNYDEKAEQNILRMNILEYAEINELWHSRKVSLFTTFIFFFTPRIFADSFYNNKDCILMTFIIISLYFGIHL